MLAAENFYRAAQKLSVPLLIISRHLAAACRLPRGLFDALEDHGGRLGQILANEQREAIESLWQQACAPPDDLKKRLGLPPRCDRNWFLKTFCNGKDVESDNDVWAAVESINVYNPLSLISALQPEFINKYLDATHMELYTAKHRLLGISAQSPGITDRSKMRRMLCQCILKGAVANQSSFKLGLPPPLSVSFVGEEVESEMFRYSSGDEVASGFASFNLKRQSTRAGIIRDRDRKWSASAKLGHPGAPQAQLKDKV